MSADACVDSLVAEHTATARSGLGADTEAELPEIQAWRRAFAQLGLKPTQYRCASEALLRRLRKEGDLPRIHPLVDLCNALSLAFAIPIAALDVSKIAGDLTVRYAVGDESYLSFAGDEEHPEPGEVIFADGSAQAHARRWTNRQSGRSVVRAATTDVLIVAEALHLTAAQDVHELTATLTDEIRTVWGGRVSAQLRGGAG